MVGSEHDTIAERSRLFGSFDTGGCHFTSADGSVHFISENVQLDGRLAQRGDGGTDAIP